MVFDLAYALHMTVAQLEAAMDGDEFLDWLAWLELEKERAEKGELTQMVERELLKARQD